jgi:hypothetical protein
VLDVAGGMSGPVKSRKAFQITSASHNLGKSAKNHTMSGCLSGGRILNLLEETKTRNENIVTFPDSVQMQATIQLADSLSLHLYIKPPPPPSPGLITRSFFLDRRNFFLLGLLDL